MQGEEGRTTSFAANRASTDAVQPLTQNIFGPPPPNDVVHLIADLLYSHGGRDTVEFELKFGLLRDKGSSQRLLPPIQTCAVLDSSDHSFYFDSQIGSANFKRLNSVLNETQKQYHDRMSYQHTREVDLFYEDSVRITRRLPQAFQIQSVHVPKATSAGPNGIFTTPKREFSAESLVHPTGIADFVAALCSLGVVSAVKKATLAHLNIYTQRSACVDYRISAKEEQPLNPESAPNYLSLSPSVVGNMIELRAPMRIRLKDRIQYTFEIWSIDLTFVRLIDLGSRPSEADSFELEIELIDRPALNNACFLARNGRPNHLLHFADTWVKIQGSLARAMKA